MNKIRRPHAPARFDRHARHPSRVFVASVASVAFVVLFHLAATTPAQSPKDTSPAARPLPKEIRGYKVERASIKRRTDAKQPTPPADSPVEPLVQLGEPRVSNISLLGLTLEIPLVVAPVKQGGAVDFLIFEDMRINGTPVSIDEYSHPFRLPNKQPLTLEQPIRVYVTTPRLLLGAYDEWNESKETWPVTGRVYVCGRYKKFVLNFKRAVPVEINIELPNPVRAERQQATRATVRDKRSRVSRISPRRSAAAEVLLQSVGGRRVCQSVACW